MTGSQVLTDEDIKTTWAKGGSTGPTLQADPDTKDADGTDGDSTDATDGDTGGDADGTDSDSDSQDS